METHTEEPMPLLEYWLAEAEACPEIHYAGAACLASVDDEGFPDARIVLVHGISAKTGAEGLFFATDHRSPKAIQLRREPRAALTFYWPPLERQLRIRGVVTEASEENAELSFTSRPRGSRITPWASVQSQSHADRDSLVARYQEQAQAFESHEEVPRPSTWRAYRLAPEAIEFWRASRFRLHRRRRFERGPGGTWTSRLLDP